MYQNIQNSSSIFPNQSKDSFVDSEIAIFPFSGILVTIANHSQDSSSTISYQLQNYIINSRHLTSLDDIRPKCTNIFHPTNKTTWKLK